MYASWFATSTRSRRSFSDRMPPAPTYILLINIMHSGFVSKKMEFDYQLTVNRMMILLID